MTTGTRIFVLFNCLQDKEISCEIIHVWIGRINLGINHSTVVRCFQNMGKREMGCSGIFRMKHWTAPHHLHCTSWNKKNFLWKIDTRNECCHYCNNLKGQSSWLGSRIVCSIKSKSQRFWKINSCFVFGWIGKVSIHPQSES